MDNVFNKFRNGKSITPSTLLNNEIIAFRKPDLMEEVVKQLNLNTKYEVRGHLRNTTLYGSSLPIIAKFSSNKINTEFGIEEGNNLIELNSDNIAFNTFNSFKSFSKTRTNFTKEKNNPNSEMNTLTTLKSNTETTNNLRDMRRGSRKK